MAAFLIISLSPFVIAKECSEAASTFFCALILCDSDSMLPTCKCVVSAPPCLVQTLAGVMSASMEDLSKCPGIGEKKVTLFGPHSRCWSL